MGYRVRRAATVLLALMALAPVGCAGLPFWGSSRPAPPPPETTSGGEYLIGAGDTLQIAVWKNVELGVTVPVRPDGKISVPLVDDVQAAGLTALELKELLARALAEYVANPDVTVVVTGVGSKRVSVLGGVRGPGPLNLATDLRVLDAIAASGGFTTFAKKDQIRVIRRTPDGDVEYRFDYDDYIEGRAPGSNISLAPGDVIVVPE